MGAFPLKGGGGLRVGERENEEREVGKKGKTTEVEEEKEFVFFYVHKIIF
jgi:hypothetical protein